jgi:hypothetical protein
MAWPGSYLTKSAWPGSYLPPAGGVVDDPPRTDHAALSWIRDAMIATGAFAGVAYPGDPAALELASDGSGWPVAWLRRTGGNEVSRVGSPRVQERTVLFTLFIEVEDRDDDRAAARLGAAEAAAINAVQGQAIGGFCFPAFSRIDQHREDARVAYPRRRVAISGQALYEVQPIGTHDERPLP